MPRFLNGAVQAAIARCGQPSAVELEHELTLAKSRLLTPAAYLDATRHPAREVVAAAWTALDAELERSNAWAFDDVRREGALMECPR